MHSAIAAFSASRRAHMAAEVARMMSDQPSRAIYGLGYDHQTLWDECCHAHNGRETQSGLALWAALIEPYATKLVAELPEPEVRLIAIAARDGSLNGQGRGQERDLVVRYVLEEVAASARAAALGALGGAEYTPTLWKVAPDGKDAEVLHGLMEAVRAMVGRGRYQGQDLIAAGEALDALDRILEGEPIDVNVELTAGFTAGDRDFSEGRFLHLRVNENCISLDRSRTEYSADTGGDHHSERVVELFPQGRFPRGAVEDWLRELDAVLQEKRVRLTVARDHA